MTLVITVAMAIGIIVGTITALMRRSENLVVRSVAAAYVWLFRGTPQLVQLLIFFNIALVLPHITFRVCSDCRRSN